MSAPIYLDNAATTPVRREALEAMWPALTGGFGNPSSTHDRGLAAARALAGARTRVATVLGCRGGEVVFTAGGTEANNLGIKGLALAKPRGRHILVSPLEHESVRLPASASFVFAGTSGEAILLELERLGVVCSSGSACAAGSTEPSHVLTAIGMSAELAHSAVRFTFASTTSPVDTEAAAIRVAAAVASVARIGRC